MICNLMFVHFFFKTSWDFVFFIKLEFSDDVQSKYQDIIGIIQSQ